MTYPKFVPYNMKTSVIKVTSYDEKILKGLLSNPFFEDEVEFHGLFQLILLLEQMQNEMNYPQRAMEARSFSEDSITDIPKISKTKPGVRPIATFKLSILFRQNASWQGSVLWVDKNESAQFRSELELMLLLDSALAGDGNTHGGEKG